MQVYMFKINGVINLLPLLSSFHRPLDPAKCGTICTYFKWLAFKCCFKDTRVSYALSLPIIF